MVKVLIDTNVIISALLFGGKPREILKLAITKHIEAVTSPPLLAELLDVLSKKFSFPKETLKLTEHKIKQSFRMVHPIKQVDILNDNNPDNRVLEAALEGNCRYIITGDKELLALGSFEDVTILTANKFLNLL